VLDQFGLPRQLPLADDVGGGEAFGAGLTVERRP
jgi:hypothetical protein